MAAEREALRDTVRKFLRKEHLPAVLRRLIEEDAGFDPDIWQRGCSDLGLAAMTLPATHDGLGLGLAELAIVMEEMGQSLVMLPYLSSAVLGSGALEFTEDEAAIARLMPAIAAGCRVALAAPLDRSPLGVTALPNGSGWKLSGKAELVLDGATCQLLLVAADTLAGPSLFEVEIDAPGLGRASLQTLDLTRRLATIDLLDVPAMLIGAPGQAGAVLDKTFDRALVALAAEQLGGARACLEMSVDYARTRFQFGRQIGSFQAIKHKCADMLVSVEAAAAALAYALEDEGAPARASLAKAICSEAFDSCATHNIQIHGGIGFTWEHDAHLYFRRAKASRALFGDPAFHRERYAQFEFAGARAHDLETAE
ncbi:MAG: acyl-CoA dehydrogenase [Sphingomonadales bacterium]|nr:MAG: acyl-CoA dehydrogenase [Sphingomonadales bacterium]